MFSTVSREETNRWASRYNRAVLVSSVFFSAMIDRDRFIIASSPPTCCVSPPPLFQVSRFSSTFSRNLFAAHRRVPEMREKSRPRVHRVAHVASLGEARWRYLRRTTVLPLILVRLRKCLFVPNMRALL